MSEADILQQEEMRLAQIQKGDAMSDEASGQDYKFQANPTLGGIMFNLRGQTAKEVRELWEGFAEEADAMFDAHTAIRQVTLAKGLTVVPAVGGNGTSHASPAAASTASDLRCQHGPYKDVKGKRKQDGTPYKYRYMCPGPFGANCFPKDLAGQQPWSE